MRFRTDVENLFLSEMVEEDRQFVMIEDTIDDIIPENNKSIFDNDSTSSADIYDSILDDNEDNIF